jgi:drug/metabolite transporter (DMT)-like permease
LELLSGTTLGAVCALGSAFTWALIGLGVRSLAQSFNWVTINALRTSGGAVLLLAWALLAVGTAPLADVSLLNLVFLIVSAVVGYGIGDTIFFSSTRSLGLARATTVSMTYPLIAAVLATGFLGEPLTLRMAAGSLLTLGGVTLIVTVTGEDTGRDAHFWRGFGEATLAAVAWAITAILLKPPLQEIDVLTAQAIRMPVAGAVFWVTPWTRGAMRQLTGIDQAGRWLLVAISVLTAVTSVMFVAGLKFAGVAAGTVLSSTSPLFAIPLGLFFLRERLTPRAVLGSIITVLGIAVLQL